MREALNRTLKRGNVVLVKKGKYNEDFSIGVVVGTGGIVTDGIKAINSYRTCYLLENPTEYERDVAFKLFDEYIKNRRIAQEELKAKRQQIGYTSLKNTKPGDYGRLVSSNEYARNKLWVYLGKVDAYFGTIGIEELKNHKNIDSIRYKENYYAYANLKEYGTKICNGGKLSADMLGCEIRVVKNPIHFTKNGILGHMKLAKSYDFMTIDGRVNLLIK